MVDWKSINPGDRITFRAVTRFGAPKVTRVVREVRRDTDAVTVRFNGWDNFAVHPDEILEVIKNGD